METKYIEQFIDRLKNNFTNLKRKKYEHRDYKCELAHLQQVYQECNHDEIINFWNKKQKEDYFKMQHPIYNNITTTAIFSIQHKGINYVFFSENTNKYIWCGAQGHSLFNWIVVDDTIYEVWPDYRKLNFEFMMNVCSNQLEYRELCFGFTFDDRTPLWHYILDNLCYIYSIDLKKPIQRLPYFFIPNNSNITEEQLVFLRPIGIGGAHYNIDKKESLMKKFAKCVYRDSLCRLNSFSLEHDKYDLTIWLALTYRGTLKTWLQQVDGCIYIIQELQKTFKRIKVYIDGMKSYENASNKDEHAYSDDVNNDMMITISRIHSKLLNSLSNVDSISLDRITIKDAICICSQVDIAIAESGSGSFVPVMFCRKPTVMYGNSNYIKVNSPIHYPDSNVKIISSKYIKSTGSHSEKWDDRNYHVPWQHIYNLSVELLENLSYQKKIKISNLKLEQLLVPSVDLLAKQYDLKQKFGVNISMENIALYYEAKDQINTLNSNIILEQVNSKLLQEKAIELDEVQSKFSFQSK
ncbi:hypothetical protein CX019_07850, partial [Campylobacter coli]|nr:hypothetical protein [Campylobacter coli]